MRLLLWASALALSASKPPHVIFNVIDDWGYNDVGFHSSAAPGADVITPYIDSLAQGGVRLSDYNVFRFCSPSRSTFLSGRMPYHIGQQTGMNLNPMPGIACGINTAYHYLPQVLRDNAGYKSCALGKWHLGYYNRSQTATYRGFESYLGYYSGAEEHFTHEKAGCGSNYYDLANNTGAQGAIAPADSRLVGDNGTYSVWLYGNESVRLIEAHDADTPLYMYLAWNVVHAPCEAPQHYIDRHAHIEDKGRRNFAAMLSSLDEALPQVVGALKAKNMWDNTIFIVTTDNGGNLGGSGNNWPLRGGKFTFWQGGVRGNAFINSPLLPKAMVGEVWGGLAHAADWYTTIAALAGVTPEQVGMNNTKTGPVPPDGVALWDAISSNSSSPRAEVVINIDAASGLGVLRQGKWKLIDGYPGNGHAGWDGWVPLPNKSNGLADAQATHWLADADVLAGPYLTGASPLHGEADRPCSTSPCLFDVLSDPEERNDVAPANPTVVKAMLARLAELGGSEVTVDESGLCPFVTGAKSDCQCAQKAKENGFWMPWCDAGYSCKVAPAPTPAPAPAGTCSAEARAAPPAVFAEVRADAPLADAGAMQEKQAWDITEHGSAGDTTVVVQLRSNSSLCMGVSGHTLRNPKTADVRLLYCDAADPAQQWRRVQTGDAQTPSEFGLAPVSLGTTGALDLQQGKINMCAVTRGKRDFNDNERFAYNVTMGLLSLARKSDLVVNVC